MIDKNLLSILICPTCRENLEAISPYILNCKKCKKQYRVVDGIPIFFDQNSLGDDLALAHEKWEVFYHNFDWEKELKAYNQNNLPYIFKHVEPIRSGSKFMEIGSGASFLCFALASRGIEVIAIDFDIAILQTAKKYFEKYKVKGHFICANVQNLPLATNTIDVSAGIGVIEHTNDITLSLKEIARVTRQGGFTFQTVPVFSLTTLILNQRYGTIPHIPVLKDIFILFHIKFLKAHHMAYGYEESFTRGFLKHSFEDAGFTSVTLGFFDYGQSIMRKVFGKILRPLIRLRPFWDIVFIKAYK
ncbi:MAG TPA: methyltransferase domain-containing protein [Candidatus Paceibacterota bacterium]|nr:methyltransferase domain-containing protein [Candidatus Paceibacterota bacterium]